MIQTGAALAPIAVVLVLLALRLPSLFAGTAGLICAVVAAATVFEPTADQISAAVGQLGPTVAEVALILLGGVTLATALSATGARDQISDWLAQVGSDDNRMPAILLLVFGLTPFMESVTGFGLGVVITAPLLVRMGLSPVKAVVTGLLGMVLVPWGSLGPGTLVAAELGGQDFAELGVWSALLTLPVLIVSIVTVLIVVAARLSLRLFALCAVVVATQWISLVAANFFLGTPPAGILSSTAVIALLLAMARLRHGPLPTVTRELARTVVPFVVLLAGILGATALLSLTGRPPALEWATSPALWVIVAALVAVRSYSTPGGEASQIVRTSLRTWMSVAATAIVFLLIGIVMATVGMAAHLAELATGFGTPSLALIPAVGALGGYLTGTNTGSAAMFSSATTGATAALGADSLVTLAGQNVAGSFAIIVSPPRVALAVGVVMTQARLPGSATRTLASAVLIATVILGATTFVLA